MRPFHRFFLLRRSTGMALLHTSGTLLLPSSPRRRTGATATAAATATAVRRDEDNGDDPATFSTYDSGVSYGKQSRAKRGSTASISTAKPTLRTTSHGSAETAEDSNLVLPRSTAASYDRPGRRSSTDAAGALVEPPRRAKSAGSTPGVYNGDANESLSAAPASVLANPLRGLHGEMERSYRIEQLLEHTTDADALFGRQEKKSTAFSFLRWRAGEAFYDGHWSSVSDIQQHVSQMTPGAVSQRPLPSLAARGTAIPGLTLFNNDLGLQNPLVQCSYPLILAQRLLMFPDSQRHFHSVCGRDGVPCDFFADIDLPNETVATGEKLLLEVLNYLEVRLPGVGFTNPFFLVLANEGACSEKVSYHVHARSMTHAMGHVDWARHSTRGSGAAGEMKASAGRKGQQKTQEVADAKEDDDDDLTDLVNVIDGSASGSGASRRGSAATTMIAFHDYRTVKLIADEVNQTLGRTVIDEGCYRPHGMLRCAFNSKMTSTQEHDHLLKRRSTATMQQRRLLPLLTASDAALQRRLSEMEAVLRTMSDPEIMELSFCTRHLDDPKLLKKLHQHAQNLVVLDRHSATAGSLEQLRIDDALRATTRHKFRLIKPRQVLGPQSDQAVEFDAYGNVVSSFLTEGAKWRRYKAVVSKLRSLTPRAAESYDVWVRVGLALHNFSNEDHVFDEWVRFSLKCPQKYSRDVCRRKWVQFERNPDALNWRRGYNYLNSTVWRQV